MISSYDLQSTISALGCIFVNLFFYKKFYLNNLKETSRRHTKTKETDMQRYKMKNKKIFCKVYFNG